MMMENERKVVLAIDFNNIAFMSSYSKRLVNSKGMEVNGIQTFFQKLRTYIGIFEPDYLVCASDLSREKTFRRKIYPAYKGQRGPIDPTIKAQMKFSSQIFELLGFFSFWNIIIFD